MSKKTVKFNKIRVNKKEFHESKEQIDLMSIWSNSCIDQIVVSDKFKDNNEDFKYLTFTKKVELLNHFVLFYLK